jgi:phosphotransacetylase
MKGVVSPVTGKADILVVPDLEDGSMLVKQLLFLADAQSCGILPFGGSRSKQGLQCFPTFSLFFISLFFFSFPEI